MRTIARWLGTALHGLGHRAAQRHRPDFSIVNLARVLGDRPQGGDGLPGGTIPDLELHLAWQARERFAPRFFVAPETISALWRRLEEEHSPWWRAHVESVAADTVRGIPLYEDTGPILGAGFPWAHTAPGAQADPLYAMRPHRFAFAPRSALACLHDPAAPARLRAMLEGWVETAAGGASPHCYASSLVAIQRIVALSWCWAFLAARPLQAGPEGAGLELLALRILHADLAFVEPLLGRAAPNNHLLADRFAAWYARTLFPEFLRQPDTGDEAAWRDEFLRQIYPDGGSFEHSAHYHELACEMGVAYILLCRRRGCAPDRELAARVEAALRFQLTLDAAGSPLPLGNGTEDALFPLDAGEGACPGALRELYRALFRAEAAPAHADDPSAVRAYWLLGGRLAPVAEPSAEEANTSFPDSGLYLQHDRALDARLAFRTGPRHGVAASAGHMHADLLGIYLAVAGEPLFVDSGTFSYRRKAERAPAGLAPWRAYLAGPQAHNGLAVAGHDPLGALHRDLRAFDTSARVVTRRRTGLRLDLVDARLSAAGPYDGLARACLHLKGAYWLVVDFAPTTAVEAPAAWYGFQCAAGSRVSVTGRRASISPASGGPTVELIASDTLAPPAVLEGSLDPLGGWVSPRYGELVAAPQLRFPLGTGTSAFVLAVGVSPLERPAVELDAGDDGVVRLRVRRGDIEDRFILDAREHSAHPIVWEGLAFEGRLLWVSLDAGRPVEAEWLDGRRLRWAEYALDLELGAAGRQTLSTPAAAASRSTASHEPCPAPLATPR